MKLGSLIRYSYEMRLLHNDEAIGIVIGDSEDEVNTLQRAQYVKVYWFDIGQEHEEQIEHLEILSFGEN